MFEVTGHTQRRDDSCKRPLEICKQLFIYAIQAQSRKKKKVRDTNAWQLRLSKQLENLKYYYMFFSVQKLDIDEPNLKITLLIHNEKIARHVTVPLWSQGQLQIFSKLTKDQDPSHFYLNYAVYRLLATKVGDSSCQNF